MLVPSVLWHNANPVTYFYNFYVLYWLKPHNKAKAFFRSLVMLDSSFCVNDFLESIGLLTTLQMQPVLLPCGSHLGKTLRVWPDTNIDTIFKSYLMSDPSSIALIRFFPMTSVSSYCSLRQDWNFPCECNVRNKSKERACTFVDRVNKFTVYMLYVFYLHIM